MLLTNLLLILGCAIALWLYSCRIRNVNIVDIFWGTGFSIVAIVTFLGTRIGWTASSARATEGAVESQMHFPKIALTAMVILWGIRLSTYLAIRSNGKPEDHRYAAMRQYWGERFAWRSLLTVFGLQAVLIWFISLPVQLGLLGNSAAPWQLVLGGTLWLVGLTFESVGDLQMFRFKKDPVNRGRVMDRGLWRYTRHPNYFGDFLVWWGIFAVSAQTDSWWWTISAPALMSFLLLRVSGVTLLESSLKNRISGYEEYVQRTSAFFPRPPKGSSLG
jgi:steroid 5-alpha reductase family enzyme